MPALISLFRTFKVCSVVISGEDRPGNSYDIRPLSDLILEFTEPLDSAANAIPSGIVQASKVTAVRVPSGQIGGRWGILGRDNSGKMDFYLPPITDVNPSAGEPLA